MRLGNKGLSKFYAHFKLLEGLKMWKIQLINEDILLVKVSTFKISFYKFFILFFIYVLFWNNFVQCKIYRLNLPSSYFKFLDEISSYTEKTNLNFRLVSSIFLLSIKYWFMCYCWMLKRSKIFKDICYYLFTENA